MLRRQNRVLFWIDGHIPSRVIEFFLTDWIQEDSLHGHRIGYIWVSSFDQNPERQLEHIQVDRLFTDKASGKDTQHPELERLLAFAAAQSALAYDSFRFVR